MSTTRRIAKNTLYLYLRMLVQMAVSLFTVRIVFNELGIDNYGIYNVVGGVIVFFSFLSNGLNAASRRYLTTELATGTEQSNRHVFTQCLVSHLLLCVALVALAETVGLALVTKVLHLPAERMTAALWVYQFSVASAVVGIVQAPYQALIVAHERMKVFAYLSIVDVWVRLGVAYLLVVMPGDVLIHYGWLTLLASMLNMGCFWGYARRKLPLCRWHYRKDLPLLKEIFSYMGWSLLNQAALVGSTQGVSLLVNVYYNVAVNAAIGVSNQVSNVVNNFAASFETAYNPAIIKEYAQHQYERLNRLIAFCSKISGLLIAVFLVPLCIEAPRVLTLWLGHYPPLTVEFCLLTLLAIYVDSLGTPLWMLIFAQKDIRHYQLITSPVFTLTFFGAWACLALGWPAYSVMGVRVAVYVLLLGFRLVYVRRMLPGFSISQWCGQVAMRNLAVLLVSLALTYVFAQWLPLDGLVHIVVVTLFSSVTMLCLILGIGISSEERKTCGTLIRTKFKR